MTRRRGKPDIRPKRKIASKRTLRSTDTGKEVNIIRVMADDAQTLFSDGLIIQHRDDIFALSFLSTEFPLITSEAEAMQIEDIEQKCVVQLVVSPIQMARNVNVMNKNFANFLKGLDSQSRRALNTIAQLPEEWIQTENEQEGKDDVNTSND